MFSAASQTEVDLDLARRSVRQAALGALDHLDRPGGDLETDLAETTRRTGELTARMAVLEELTTKVARWSAVLVRLALSEPDPLQRFRNHYAAGDYRQALDALPEPPDDPGDRRHYARCLAETGDAEGYRALRRSEVDGPGPVTGTRVQVRVAGAPTGTGFLISPQLVVTSRTWLADQVSTPDISVGAVRVEHIHLPDSPDHDLALLRLTEPVDVVPPRLGYPKLVRIGDQVRTPGPDGVLVTGVVDRFEPVTGVLSFHTGLTIPSSCVGGPVVDELGEVIGIVVGANGARVLSIDALDPLLTEVEFDRHS
jgi:molecular chaperone DnaK